MNKHFLNEKGITLTELLAALALFAIVGALVMTVLFNVFQNSENISDNAQLRQDANLLISTLRSNYNQGDFKVGLNDSKSLLIDEQEVNSSMTSSIDELKLENGEKSISAVTESMTVTADGTPLSIDLKLKNEAGQTYSISTTIEKPDELAITLLPVPPDPGDPESYEKGAEGEYADYCRDRDVDTKYNYDNSNQFIPDGCKKEITITGNVWFLNNPHFKKVEMKHVVDMDAGDGAKFHVTGNLFVDPAEEFNIDNTHPVNVGGDALFRYGKLQLKNKSELTAENIHALGGDHTGAGVVVLNQTRLKARQSMVVTKNFEMYDHGHAIIGKNLIIDGDLKMYSHTEITVEGHARIGGDLILSENSNLTIKGNLVITGEVKQDNDKNNRTIHVGGMTNFSNGKPSWLTVENY